MAKKETYRLEAFLKIKMAARKKTEIALAKALRALKEEETRLAEIRELKQKTTDKKNNYRQEMNQKIRSGQSRIKESQSHLNYLRKLEDDLERLTSEIAAQKELVEEAQKKVKRARRDYVDAATEQNIMEKHRELWLKKQAQLLSALENKQMNELGNTVHQLNRMRSA